MKEIRVGRFVFIENRDGELSLFDTETNTGVGLDYRRVGMLENFLFDFYEGVKR